MWTEFTLCIRSPEHGSILRAHGLDCRVGPPGRRASYRLHDMKIEICDSWRPNGFQEIQV